jgi:peptidyl-prolyl cis-trans isomerase SurA
MPDKVRQYRTRRTNHAIHPALWALLLIAMASPVAGHAANPVGAAKSHAQKPAQQQEEPLSGGSRIAAVVNGDVISNTDIDNRARLFAMSTGMPLSQDIVDRLRPQILRQLIDERLRVQEAQRRKIVIPDAQIASAMKDIESRNNMAAGTLRQKLAADGVSTRTLIDQIRAQLGWSQVLRQDLADRLNVSPADVEEQQKLSAQRNGQMEYRIGEIFIPIEDPANSADAQRFAETVIKELHAGAAFPLVAAQFSQTQTALEGGQVGWIQANQLDPQVAQIVAQMPVGAISNPVRVPGGISIVALEAKREIGHDMATVVTLRQAFVSFTQPLTDPQHPTEQQRQALQKVHSIASSVNSCAAMEQAAKAVNAPNRPIDPGEIRADGVNPPAFRQLLMTIPIGKPTEPLISKDGIAVVTVCSREQKNVAEVTPEDIQRRLVEERAEMTSRQLMRDLKRKATITMRNQNSST